MAPRPGHCLAPSHRPFLQAGAAGGSGSPTGSLGPRSRLALHEVLNDLVDTSGLAAVLSAAVLRQFRQAIGKKLLQPYVNIAPQYNFASMVNGNDPALAEMPGEALCRNMAQLEAWRDALRALPSAATIVGLLNVNIAGPKELLVPLVRR